MAFPNNPKTDQQLEDIKKQAELDRVWGKGKAFYKVLSAEQYVNEKENTIIKLTLKIWKIVGKEKTIFSYLTATDNMEFLTKHFCESNGLHKEYSAGSFDVRHCHARTGELLLEPNPDKNGVLWDRVIDFIPIIKATPKDSTHPAEISFD